MCKHVLPCWDDTRNRYDTLMDGVDGDSLPCDTQRSIRKDIFSIHLEFFLRERFEC